MGKRGNKRKKQLLDNRETSRYGEPMATSIDKERLRKEFERVASSDGSDSEARFASPRVEGMVVFLESVATRQSFEIEKVRHVFQAKGCAEGADITFSELEDLVEAIGTSLNLDFRKYTKS